MKIQSACHNNYSYNQKSANFKKQNLQYCSLQNYRDNVTKQLKQNTFQPSFGGGNLRKFINSLLKHISKSQISPKISKTILPIDIFNKLCKENKSLIKDIDADKLESVKKILSKSVFPQNDDGQIICNNGDFLWLLNYLLKFSSEQLKICEKFTDMTSEALKSGKIRNSKVNVYNLFTIGQKFKTEEEVETAFNILHAEGANLKFDDILTGIMRCFETPEERLLARKFASGAYGEFDDKQPLVYFANEVFNFHKKNNRPLNKDELKIFEGYLSSLKYRTENDYSNYYGDCINELIPITTPQNQKSIIELLKSKFVILDKSPNTDCRNEIVNLFKYGEQNPDIKNLILPYATRADGCTFAEIKDFFDFFKAEKKNPLLERISQNVELKTSEIINLYKQIKANPEEIKIFGKYLATDNYRYLQFLSNAVKKYPQLRETIIFQSNLPADYIAKKGIACDEKLNENARKKLIEITGSDGKIKAMEALLSEDEVINWNKILPENLTYQKANLIINSLFEIISYPQRLNSIPNPKWSDWALKVKNITDFVTCEIKSGYDFSKIIDDISENYSYLFKNTDFGKKRKNDYLLTPYSERRYAEYKDRFDRLAETTRKSPYADMEITQIESTSLQDQQTMAMIHPAMKTLNNALEHAKEHYDRIMTLLTIKALYREPTCSELKFASDEIATIHYIMTNTTPFFRGSAGIAGILTRSLNRAIGIENTATKRNIALDLEAFCRDLDDYKKNWFTFFEMRPEN